MSLTKALQPHNLADFADVTVTPGVFSVKICEMSIESQQFMVRVSNVPKDHPIFSTDNQVRTDFIDSCYRGEINDDTIAVLVNAIVVDWALKDDDGTYVPYTTDKAAEIFTDYPRIARKLMKAALQPTFFEQDALKN